MLAGDFLSSSVASTVFKGEQMIAALNAAGLDVATLGNHEFDFGVEVLLQRMAEARFSWVISNVVDTQTGQPIGGAVPTWSGTFGSLRVGFIGLCLAEEGIGRDKVDRLRIVDPFEAAGKLPPEPERRRESGRHRRADAPDITRRTGARREVSGDRRHRRRARALSDHGGRRTAR